MGRQPTSNDVLKIRGSRHAGKSPESVVLAGVPSPPDDLSVEALAEWASVCETLAAVGTLCTADRDSIAGYVLDGIELKRLEQTIKAEGEVLAGVKGGKYPHPAVSMRQACLKRRWQFRKDYGLTAVSRKAMRIEVAKGDEPKGIRSRQRGA